MTEYDDRGMTEQDYIDEQDEAALYDEIDAYHNEPIPTRCTWCGFTATMTQKSFDEGNWFSRKGLVLCPDHSHKAPALEAIECPF